MRDFNVAVFYRTLLKIIAGDTFNLSHVLLLLLLFQKPVLTVGLQVSSGDVEFIDLGDKNDEDDDKNCYPFIVILHCTKWYYLII